MSLVRSTSRMFSEKAHGKVGSLLVCCREELNCTGFAFLAPKFRLVNLLHLSGVLALKETFAVFADQDECGDTVV